jgi:hypothetical protein
MMSIATYSGDLAAGIDAGREAGPIRKPWLQRFFAALAEARMRTAIREIRRHRHFLPTELEWTACKLSPNSVDQLPFLRRFD